MAIFEVFNWTCIPQVAAEHEAIIDKYLFILKLLKTKIGKLISARYFSHAYGENNSPLGGRVLILEYEDMTAYEAFQSALSTREDYQGFQKAWGQVIIPSTLRASLWVDRNRNAWFAGQGTEIIPR